MGALNGAPMPDGPRLVRLEFGLLGDWKAVGNEVAELHFDHLGHMHPDEFAFQLIILGYRKSRHHCSRFSTALQPVELAARNVRFRENRARILLS
jgi:hypothetical protein